MATVGLRDLHYALVTENDQGEDTYGTPKILADAISADMSVEVAEAILYSNDAAAAVARDFIKGALKLGVGDLPQTVTAELLGQTVDSAGVVIAGGDDTPPYVAIGFRAMRNDGTFRYIWLYKVKFSVPNEKYQTKADKIEFNTPEIEGTFIKRKDGNWKADYTGDPKTSPASDWFTAVYETDE